MSLNKIIAVGLLAFTISTPSYAGLDKPSPVVENYNQIVLTNYTDSLNTAKIMQAAIQTFLDNPTDENLAKAKQAWIDARVPYTQTEVYRFYEGPIDFTNLETGETGPEARINSWPLNEAYIDYVVGNPKSGIINDSKTPITIETLKEKNQQKDEVDVATGYHAIEFLLWGQDLDKKGPGARPASDYAKSDKIKQRRREYLKQVTALLIQDLDYLVNAWEPKKQGYPEILLGVNQKDAIGKILTGAATMAGVELSGERMNNGLISGDQEDEQDCFSDNTISSFTGNFKGIENVYLGQYGSVKGDSISGLVGAKNPELDSQIKAQIARIYGLINGIEKPYDQVLAAPADSPQKKQVKDTVKALQDLGKMLQLAGAAIGAKVEIISE